MRVVGKLRCDAVACFRLAELERGLIRLEFVFFHYLLLAFYGRLEILKV
jgi:hypothetical protein